MSTTQKIRSIGREARVNELISERLEHWKATMRERGEFFNVIHSRVSHRHFHFVCDQVQCGSAQQNEVATPEQGRRQHVIRALHAYHSLHRVAV